MTYDFCGSCGSSRRVLWLLVSAPQSQLSSTLSAASKDVGIHGHEIVSMAVSFRERMNQGRKEKERKQYDIFIQGMDSKATLLQSKYSLFNFIAI